LGLRGVGHSIAKFPPLAGLNYHAPETIAQVHLADGISWLAGGAGHELEHAVQDLSDLFDASLG
jgi:hypothetical protein